MEAADDIYAEFDPPKVLPYIGTLVGVSAFIGTAHFTDNSAPFFAAISIGIIAMLIGLTWPLRRRWLLWVLITTVALVHAAVLFSIPLPSKVSYGIAFAPFGAIDIYVFWRLIIRILKITDPVSAH